LVFLEMHSIVVLPILTLFSGEYEPRRIEPRWRAECKVFACKCDETMAFVLCAQG
jgi:hypothetical protein